jgi:hypothetical protein
MRNCSNCGAAIPAGVRFCGYCGAESRKFVVQVGGLSSRTVARIVVWVIVGLVVAAFAAFLIYRAMEGAEAQGTIDTFRAVAGTVTP